MVPFFRTRSLHRKDTADFVMASGRTIKQCAADLGVNDKTLSNWVADRKRELGVEGTARLKPAGPKADPELAAARRRMRGTLRRLCKGLWILFSRALDRTIGTPPRQSTVGGIGPPGQTTSRCLAKSDVTDPSSSATA